MMRSSVVAVIVIAGVCVGACAVEDELSTNESTKPVVNGELDPFDHGVVGLVFQGRSFCTGTLVSPKVVVTAAHCEPADGFEGVSVFFGPQIGRGTYITAVDGKVHGQYQGGSNDIAMLLLERPAPARYYSMLRQPFDASFVDLPVRVAGFGAIDGDAAGDGLKRDGIARITDFDELDFSYVSDPAQTCFGDSGGPGFVTVDGAEYLAGVTSRGDTECNIYGIDTRVDAYVDWVDFYIQVNDELGTCAGDGICAIDCAAPDPDCPCETDGFCTTACEQLNGDADCPPGCDHDGVCTGEGCPAEDSDCNPTAELGGACEFDTDCVMGTCMTVSGDLASPYCSMACGDDSQCPDPLVCDPIDDSAGAATVCRFAVEGGGGGCCAIRGGDRDTTVLAVLAVALAIATGRRRRGGSRARSRSRA